MEVMQMGIIFLIAQLATSASINRSSSSSDPLVLNLENLPEEEKSNFLSYFLAVGVSKQSGSRIFLHSTKEIPKEVDVPQGLGISDDQIKKFQTMNIPESSVNKLVSWTQSEFKINENEVVHLAVKKEFCDARGCINLIPDVNQLCCPW